MLACNLEWQPALELASKVEWEIVRDMKALPL
jgi:hypothetical protein